MAEIVNLATYRAARGRRDIGALGKFDRTSPIDRRRNLRHLALERRVEPRHQISGELDLTITLGARSATLENVSPNGLMAAAILAVGPGSRILVSVAGCADLSGRVIWTRQGKAGIEVPIGSLQLSS